MDLLQTILDAAAGLTGVFAVLAGLLALAFAAALLAGLGLLATLVLGLFGIVLPWRRRPPTSPH